MSHARTVVAAVCALVATLTLVPTASGSLFAGRVTADDAQKRRCDARLVGRGADGIARRTVELAGPSLLRASLRARRGDWDLGLFQKSTGRSLGGSAGLRSTELAEVFVPAGEIVVQACRRKGGARKARMKVTAIPVPLRAAGEKREIAQLVRVATPHPADQKRLQSLGLDLTEHGGDGHLEVVLHGQGDAKKLRAAGFSYEVEIADLAARNAQNRLADARYARRVKSSSLPSERDSYRRLVDFENDIKALAENHPDLAKAFQLPYKSIQGRPIYGVEITRDVGASDGKPVFLQMGVHHAREWPSGEVAMEFALDLVSNYGTDPRVTELMNTVRTIVVPIVNPDGYNLSREAPMDMRALGTTGPVTRAVMDDLRPTGIYGDLDSAGLYAAGLTAGGVAHQYGSNPGGIAAILIDSNTGNFAYKRRNCRMPAGRNPDCAHSSNRSYGTDPNRNYGGFWGGPGASNSTSVDTFRGTAPFSEPEVMNVRELVTSRQVTALITNHTYSNLVLRPPGIAAEGPAPDEPAYKALGDAMGLATGYTSQYGFQLYDTTGTTEDWSYYQTGGYGFTFEIGPHEFHPPYEQVVAEYEGNQPHPVDDHTATEKHGGLREAYLLAMEHAANATHHAVLTGKGPKGARLEARRTGSYLTSPVVGGNGPLELADTATSSMTIPKSGRFEWHLNPSTRPYAERDRFAMASEPAADPAPQPIAGGPVPPVTTIPVEIKAGEPRFFVARVAGAKASDDYDLYFYRGDLPDPREYQASSATSSNAEQITLENLPPGRYTLEVRNFSATGGWTGAIERRDGDPNLGTAAATEAWSITCTKPDGEVSGPHSLVVDRGQRLDATTLCRSGRMK